MSLLPLRPGALAALNAGDYEHRLYTLRVGKEKTGKARNLVVPEATASFLNEHRKGKAASQPLLARDNGTATPV